MSADDINTMIYEAFMAEYGHMPNEVDERFSLRQMLLLLEAKNHRKKNEARILANEVWEMAFGSNPRSMDDVELVSHTEGEKKDLSFFGISEG